VERGAITGTFLGRSIGRTSARLQEEPCKRPQGDISKEIGSCFFLGRGCAEPSAANNINRSLSALGKFFLWSRDRAPKLERVLQSWLMKRAEKGVTARSILYGAN